MRNPYRATWKCRFFGHKNYRAAWGSETFNYTDYCSRCFLPTDPMAFLKYEQEREGAELRDVRIEEANRVRPNNPRNARKGISPPSNPAPNPPRLEPHG